MISHNADASSFVGLVGVGSGEPRHDEDAMEPEEGDRAIGGRVSSDSVLVSSADFLLIGIGQLIATVLKHHRLPR